MQINQLKKLRRNTLVVVPIEDWDMGAGWDKSMSAMVGIPLPVYDISTSRGCVLILHPVTKRKYNFNYTHVELWDNFTFDVTIGGAELCCNKIVDGEMFSGYLAGTQYQTFREVTGQKGRVIELSSEILIQLQQKCPQAIGTMLFRRLLTRKNHG